MSDWVHATAVLYGSDGILIAGPSGAGKSALAGGLISRGAILVADDRVQLSARAGRLVAAAPAAIAGLMELRGRGIVSVPFERTAVIRLVVELVPAEALERHPEPSALVTTVLGVPIARQPVPPDPVHGIQLVEAALAAIRADRRVLRSAGHSP